MRDLVVALRLIRLPNTLTAAADVLAGAAIAGIDPLQRDVLVCASGSALLYAGGIALNDRIDLEKDRNSAPDRVLPRGDLAARTASWLALLLMAGGAAPMVVGDPRHIAITGGLVAAIVLYDVMPERRKWIGCAVMGACRALNLLRGMTLAASPLALQPHGAAATAHFALILLVTAVSTFEGVRRRGAAFRVALLLLPLPYLVPALLCSWWALFGGVLLGAWVTTPGWVRDGRPVEVVKRAIFTLVVFDALYAIATENWVTAAVLLGFLPVIQLLAKLLDQRGS